MKESLEKLSKIQELLEEAIKLSGELSPLLASHSLSLSESEIGSLLEQELLFLKKEIERNLNFF